MPSSFAIQSPLDTVADLFLDGFEPSSSNLFLAPALQADETFTAILENSVQRMKEEEEARASGAEEAAYLAVRPESPVRRSPLEEFRRQVESLGLPPRNLKLDPQDLGRLRKLLEESGYDQAQVDQVFSRLAQGPLTLDRVLAALGSLEPPERSSLSLTSTALPFLGRFLQDLGFAPDRLKEILSNLKPGQPFGAALLREIFLKNGQKNLQGLTLAQVDPKNLRDLLTALGVDPKEQERFWSKLGRLQGRMSVEGFLGYLKSLTRPEALSRDQVQEIRTLVQNLAWIGSLRLQPYFNRIVSLLLSMGDPEIKPKFMADNPAVQALRSGASGAQAILGGSESAPGGWGQQMSCGPEAEAGFDRSAGGESLALGRGANQVQEAGFAPRLAEAQAPSNLAESVLKQVAEKMVYSARNNQHRLRINLRPPELGQLRISLAMKNNQVSASIVAENPLVKGILEGQLAQLRATLAQQGLHLDSFSVSVGFGQQSPAEPGPDFGLAGGQADLETEPEPLASPALARLGAGRVDLFA